MRQEARDWEADYYNAVKITRHISKYPLLTLNDTYCTYKNVKKTLRYFLMSDSPYMSGTEYFDKTLSSAYPVKKGDYIFLFWSAHGHISYRTDSTTEVTLHPNLLNEIDIQTCSINDFYAYTFDNHKEIYTGNIEEVKGDYVIDEIIFPGLHFIDIDATFSGQVPENEAYPYYFFDGISDKSVTLSAYDYATNRISTVTERYTRTFYAEMQVKVCLAKNISTTFPCVAIRNRTDSVSFLYLRPKQENEFRKHFLPPTNLSSAISHFDLTGREDFTSEEFAGLLKNSKTNVFSIFSCCNSGAFARHVPDNVSDYMILAAVPSNQTYWVSIPIGCSMLKGLSMYLDSVSNPTYKKALKWMELYRNQCNTTRTPVCVYTPNDFMGELSIHKSFPKKGVIL